MMLLCRLLPLLLLLSGNQDPVGSASISGVVVDSVTGAPVANAHVTLLGNPTRTRDTDALGRFAFSRLDADTYVLSAAADGYLIARLGETAPRRSTDLGPFFPLRAGETMVGVVLRLQRGGVITGRVIDPDGVPMPSVSIVAGRVRGGFLGMPRFERIANATTDSDGVYRLSDLLPGKYIVSAIPSTRPPRRVVSGTGADATPIVECYPPTFFPGVTSVKDAVAIEIAAGSQQSAELFPQAVRLARVRGTLTITGAPLDPETRPRLLTLVPEQEIQDAPTAAGVGPGGAVRADADGRFEFADVPPGQYRVVFRRDSVTAGNPRRDWGAAAISVSGADVNDVQVIAAPGVSIVGRVTLRNAVGEHIAPAFQLVAVGESLLPRDEYLRSEPSGDGFRFSGVPPGRYRIMSGIGVNGWMIDSLSGDASTSTIETIEVGSVDAGLNVTLARQSEPSYLSGIVQFADHRPAVGHIVLLLPEEPALWVPWGSHVTFSPLVTNGYYEMRVSRPGRYLLIVFAGEWEDFEWTAPEAATAMASQATRITIAPGQRLTQDITIR